MDSSAQRRGGRSALRSTWEALASEALEAVYPRRCRLCGDSAADGLACAAHALPERPQGPRCERCSAALPPVLPDGYRCALCRTSRRGFRRAVVLGDYKRETPLREWILALKHGGRAELAGPLAACLAERWMQARAEGGWRVAGDALVVPVPLHPLRRFERGYDQARLLAEGVARSTGQRALRALRRRRHTAPQGAPGAVSRQANVADAFAVVGSLRALLDGREVWLVDDVLTSGSTAAACARALRSAGATAVSVLALARATAA